MVGEFVKNVGEWRLNVGEYSAILVNLDPKLKSMAVLSNKMEGTKDASKFRSMAAVLSNIYSPLRASPTFFTNSPTKLFTLQN